MKQSAASWMARSSSGLRARAYVRVCVHHKTHAAEQHDKPLLSFKEKTRQDGASVPPGPAAVPLRGHGAQTGEIQVVVRVGLAKARPGVDAGVGERARPARVQRLAEAGGEALSMSWWYGFLSIHGKAQDETSRPYARTHLERHGQARGGRGDVVAGQVHQHHVVLVPQQQLHPRQHAVRLVGVVLDTQEEAAGELDAAEHGLGQAGHLVRLAWRMVWCGGGVGGRERKGKERKGKERKGGSEQR